MPPELRHTRGPGVTNSWGLRGSPSVVLGGQENLFVETKVFSSCPRPVFLPVPPLCFSGSDHRIGRYPEHRSGKGRDPEPEGYTCYSSHLVWSPAVGLRFFP